MSLKKLSSWCVCAALVLSLAAIVSAQDEPTIGVQPPPYKRCQTRFDSLDKNQDGKLTKEEYMANRRPGGRAEETFQSKDINKDGTLTKDEMCMGTGGEDATRSPKVNCKDRFVTLDKNGDGQLSKDEYMAVKRPGMKSEQSFLRKDTDGDGRLSPDEMCAQKKKPAGQISPPN